MLDIMQGTCQQAASFVQGLTSEGTIGSFLGASWNGNLTLLHDLLALTGLRAAVDTALLSKHALSPLTEV